MVHSTINIKQIEITLSENQYSKLLEEYSADDYIVSVKEYVRIKYKGEWQAFRRSIVFTDQKYYNWFILLYDNL